MNKNILVIIMFVLGITNLYAQSDIVDVQLVYNNTADVNKSISNLVKVDELKEAIQANGHIDQNLIVRIAFFDKNAVGRMMLNAEHKLSIDDYVSEWQKMVENKNAVLFLFVKAFGIDKNTYDFDKMYVSTTLSEAHLLPLVTEYINEHLTGDNNEIISNGTHYLANAIRPVWTEEKMEQAVELSQIDKYKPNRINSEFNFSFFDWRHAGFAETSKMKLVSCATDKEWFISNKYFYTSFEQLKGKEFKSFDWDVSFGEDIENGILIIKDGFLLNVLKYYESINKHNIMEFASEWKWIKNNEALEIPSVSDFIDRTQDDKMILFVNIDYKEQEGQEISILHPRYGKTTWCNVYARDLSCIVLFPNLHTKKYAPWGKHGNANALHYVICHNPNFKKINNEEDPWEYANKGYVVYLTNFGKGISEDVLSYNQAEFDNWAKNEHNSGHIATCYPEDNQIIQAGREIGKIPWTKSDKIKIHIYLGYILTI